MWRGAAPDRRKRLIRPTRTCKFNKLRFVCRPDKRSASGNKPHLLHVESGIGLLTTCQQFQHFIHAGGCARRSMTDSSSSALVRLVITECARCYGQQYQLPDGQCHLLFTEAHAFWVLAEHHARFQYRSFASTVPCGTAIDSPR